MAKKLIPPENGKSPVKEVDKQLKKYLIGQDRPIREISRALERAFSGLKHPNHPITVLAFFGPTGTGKTYSAKILSDCFKKIKVWRCVKFNECGFEVTEDEKKSGKGMPSLCPIHRARQGASIHIEEIELPNIWTIDCGGMGGSLEHAVTNLVGAPPSYVGHGRPPLFTGGKAPKVVLFDEAEKAILAKNWRGGRSTFSGLLLKILDEGKIRNNLGEEIDFTQSVIILTGNLGAGEIISEFEGHSIGFHASERLRTRSISKMTDEEVAQLNERIYSIVKKKAERELAPEFLNRLDRLVVFYFLTQGDYEKILDIELTKVQERIDQSAVTRSKNPAFFVTYTKEAKHLLLDESMSDRRFGARPLTRTVEKRVITPLSILINNELINEGDHIEGRVEEGLGDDSESEDTIIFYQLDPPESPILLSPPEGESND